MAAPYNTSSEGSSHDVSNDRSRRRSTYSSKQALRDPPNPGSGLMAGTDTVAKTTGPSPRRPSLLSTPRRRLPWLDGKNSSGNRYAKRFPHVPGAYVTDDTSYSNFSSNAASSPSLPEISPANPTATLQAPRNASSAYSPSNYSTDATSGISIGPPFQSLRCHSSYEAVLLTAKGSEDGNHESENDQRRRRTCSHLGCSSASNSNSEPSMPVKCATLRLSPKLGQDLDAGSDRPSKPTHAEAELQRAIDGMENLMRKALDAANGATNHRESDSVSAVLEGASRSLAQTPSVSSEIVPLHVSSSPYASSDTSSTGSGAPLSPKTGQSSNTEMLPPTASAEDTGPVSPNPSHRPKEVTLPSDTSSSSSSIVLTPYQLYQRKSADSIATDWAYVHPKTPARIPSQPASSSSSSTTAPSDLERQESTRWRAWHNNKKRPVFHDDPYHRDRHVKCKTPSQTRGEVHDHIKRHGVPPMPPRSSSLRHRNVHGPAHSHSRRSRHSDHVRQIRDRRKEHRSERNERHGAIRRRKPPNPWDDAHSAPSTGFSMGEPARTHVSFRGPARMESFNRHRREPVARNWGSSKKRITATIACINTSLVGFLIGVYAGEVPRIQYAIADQGHIAIMGNVFLYLGLALSTFFCWPLPLLHGRKPYVLGALAILLPLQFPQALVVGTPRDPETHLYRVGLLLPRAFSGLVLGLANINFVTTLLDLFGASLQSASPHEELVFVNDVRRHGGGMGLWLGIWAWSFLGSIAVGFLVGALLIESVDPSWGFYIVVIMIASVLVLNVMAPETRRARFRRSYIDLIDPNSEYVYQRIVRGEIKLHISPDGPDWWGQEVAAGISLSVRMYIQLGFSVLATYIAWIYAQFVLVIVLLGALLSRDYRWHPDKVGAGVASLAIGALFAVPLTKGGLFSRERTHASRTDSMTFQRQITWTSHMTRRIVFTTLLPLASLAYTLCSNGAHVPWPLPIAFAALIGFLSVLAWAETHGLVMEAFDTCDLQPGVNTRHRLQSMADAHRRRRTPYSCFPRVCAAFATAHALAFLLAAIATWVGGALTRRFGAQASTGVVAAVLAALTVALTLVLYRFQRVQVIPDDVFGELTAGPTGPRLGLSDAEQADAWSAAVVAMSVGAADSGDAEKVGGSGRAADWKPVIIGNPSGRVRRVNLLEMGRWSRWSEIRRLNRLIGD